MNIRNIPLRFASLRKSPSIPAWAKSLRASGITVEKLFNTQSPPGVVVIQSANGAELETALKKISLDSSRLARNLAGLQLVVQFGTAKEPQVTEVTRVLNLFPKPASRVDFAWGPGRLKQSVINAAAKLIAEQQDQSAQRPDPLAEAKEVIAATRPLLAASGRLSAPAIAKTFGLSTAKLGQIIGSSRQALAKTPDALAIQNALRPFERIARLRALLSAEDFGAWLHRSNRMLGDAPPFNLIADGRVGIVADLAEDMLMGTPG